LGENGKVTTIEFDEKHAATARKNIENAGLGKKVDILVGAAPDILPQLKKDMAAPFDMIL
jgi:predicted O-methyltransferase YrrM